MAARTLSRSCIRFSQSAPAVQAFLQLAVRRPLPVLEFLLPTPPAHGPHRNLRPLPKSTSRAFTTTSPCKQTAAIYNPRKDDDGKDMSVEITPRASNRLKEIMTKDSNPNLALRITVESGGCHGFQYLMSLTTLPPMPIEGAPALNIPPPSHNTMPSDASGSGETGVAEDDTIFKALDGSEAKVVMDGLSLELLKGSKIDYTMELIGSQFKIVDNPLATSSCGCGTSFDIKA